MKVLILGVNGFIGSALTGRILASTDWEVFGLDMASDKMEPFLPNDRLRFLEGSLTTSREWIEYHIKRCDVVLPLVAIATPSAYVKQPLAVFELTFEENLRVIKQAVQYGKRVVFPSSSEVYGMCPDKEFNEETSTFVYGPVKKQRWIYSCSKQLLDRVIWAYGESGQLRFTLFRPFNWIGPNLDNVDSPKEGSSRVLTQFLHNILYREEIKLVDGGRQRRSFTYISDGIDGLMRIISREDLSNGQVFNLGNPRNDFSIRELAERLKEAVSRYPGYEEIGQAASIQEVKAEEYYGPGYQDIPNRVPSIRKAREVLGWEPKVDFDEALKLTLDFYLTGRKGRMA
jgi:nucleoside-diphosphate-sugar epimerase